MDRKVRVAVIGMGLIGRRRAACAVQQPQSELVAVCDADPAVLPQVAGLGAELSERWESVVGRPDVDAVVISTPNKFLAPITIAALGAGKHVLLEKPMGRNLCEARSIAEAASRHGRIVKIGFNHRYHPAIMELHRLLKSEELGRVLNARVVYGHGGRPGYEKEWRGNPDLAGGGEATDQGVHVFDLVNWFFGTPQEAFAYLQTAFWPLESVEDNVFGLLRYADDRVISFHTSWTIWKNRFSFEVYCERGAAIVQGLGKSYGTEQMTLVRRSASGGLPTLSEVCFEGPDTSWDLEWDDFMGALTRGHGYFGTAEDGLSAMGVLDAVYRSARSRAPINLSL